MYEEQGVMEGLVAAPLWPACECATSCWQGIPSAFRPGRGRAGAWDGAIPLPWVGQFYRRGGVVVLGVNLNNASGLLVEYDIAINGPKSQLEALRASKKKPHGSWWAYRSLRSARAVLCSLDGQPVRDEADPVAVADTLLRVSRLQAVKCSPQDGARSSRTANMDANCPPKFLQRELEILNPRAVVAFGNESWGALDSIGAMRITTGGPNVWRALLTQGDRTREVFWLPHPASNGSLWEKSHNSLLASLRQRPAVASASRS